MSISLVFVSTGLCIIISVSLELVSLILAHVSLVFGEKKIPTVGNIFNEINDTIGTIYSLSSKTKHAAESCNFFRHGRE